MPAGAEPADFLADDLRLRITGQPRKRGVDPLDAAVGIGDDDGIGAGHQRAGLEQQFLLRALAFGDVGGHAEGAGESLRRIPQHREGHDCPDLGAVLAAQALFEARGGVELPLAQPALMIRPVFLEQEFLQRLPGHRVHRAAQHLRHAPVHKTQPPFGINGKNPFVGRFHNAPVTLLALRQRGGARLNLVGHLVEGRPQLRQLITAAQQGAAGRVAARNFPGGRNQAGDALGQDPVQIGPRQHDQHQGQSANHSRPPEIGHQLQILLRPQIHFQIDHPG